MKDPVQVRFSGAGGQGMITAGVILAEAAMLDGKNAVQTQTYGPEARLGSSRSEVIISSRTIAYPEVTTPDVLLCLSQEAARRYISRVGPGTVVILDSSNVGPETTGPGLTHRLPITAAAVELGSKVVANTVGLWAANVLAGLVSPESLREAITRRVPERFRQLNILAMEAGENLARASHASRRPEVPAS
jgi:2-oxoglutarate ferredoxin oxidoreductase subunit gamma